LYLLSTLPTRTPIAAQPASLPRATMPRTFSSSVVVAAISAAR
jgi:hypothetical protein